MKGRIIVLDPEGRHGVSAALMVDDRLEDILPVVSGQIGAGDIRRATVRRKLPKAGAFCALEDGSDGFLRDARDVREGQRILVQVVSLPDVGKAVTLTTRLLFKGPRLIVTPGAPGVNVSRRIGNEAERERLSTVVAELLDTARADTPALAEAGVIVRTSARGEDAICLDREFSILARRVTEAAARLDTPDVAPPPNETMSDPVTVDWLDPLPTEVLTTAAHAERLREKRPDGTVRTLWGDDRLAELLRDAADPMDAAGVTDALREIASATVALEHGASMVIEATRALVAVDVNTGADFSPSAGLKANLAACRQLPRQFRLRGLGGQVVVDFAPMPKQHRRTLEEALKKALRTDPVETAQVGWTGLGLYELQRKRERRPLPEKA